MIKRNAKRALSIFLSIVLTLTTFFIFDPSVLKIDTQAYVATTNPNLSNEEVFFYVPEVIYLTPSTAGETGIVAFKWFADRANADNGALTNSVADKYTGNVYFHCSSAVSYVINVSTPAGCTVSNVDTGTWKSGNSYSTDQMAGSAYNKQGQTITWTLTWSDGTRNYSTTRYSRIYKTNYVPSGGAGRSNRGSSSIVRVIGAVYIHGFANNFTGGNKYMQDAYNTALNPNWQRSGSSGWNEIQKYMYDAGGGSIKYNETTSGDPVTQNLSGLNLFIDRSRYTNYNQMPNLIFTIAFTGQDRNNSERWVCISYDYEHGGNNRAGVGNVYTVPADSATTTVYTGRISAGTPDAATSPSGHYFYGAFHGRGGRGEGWTRVYFNFNAYSFDKSSLRNAYDYAVKSSKYLQQQWYTDSAWNAYTSAFNSVADALISVENNDAGNYVNLANTLINQVNTMKNAFTGAASKSGIVKSGTVTVHHKYVTGGSGASISSTATVSSDESLTYYYGENVITGFKDLSSSPDRGYVNHGYASGNFSLGSLTLGTGNNTYSFVETASLEYTYVYLKKSLVTFNANGGSCGTANKTVTYSGTYGDLPTPSRTGYTFKGWFTATSGGSQVIASTTAWILADQTLYAQWTPNNYTVNFNPNGGSTPQASKTVTYDSTYGDLPTPTRTGYYFNGWFTSTSGGTNIVSSTKVQITSTQTLYAHWTAKTYTLTFDPNGGTLPNPGDNLYNKNPSNSVPVTTDSGNYWLMLNDIPTRAGYTFNGWYTAKSGGTQVFDSTGTAIKGTAYWNSNNQWIYDGNLTVYAQWTPNIYKVTLNNMGATSAGTTAYWYKFNTVNNGVYYYLNAECTTAMNNYTITAPQKTGYTFNGYYTQTNGAGTAYVNSAGMCINNLYQVVGDRTLYAYWTANNYTVTFNANGGSCSTASKVVTFDSTYGDLPTPARTGYTFTGWYTAETGGTKVETSTVVKTASNHTLYAHWSANTYTVIFNTNGGTCDTASKTVTFDSTYGALPTATRTGYTFNGWFTSTSGGSKVETTTVVKTASNHTVYAQWTANNYTVTFNANGGSCGTASKTVTYDSTYGDLPTPARTGYTFTGWFTSETGGSQVTTSTTVKTASNHTLYAHWSANTYTVYFNANSGSCGTASKTVTYDSTYGDLPTPARTGYTFTGWFTAQTGGTKVETSTVVKTASNHTLFAHWSANTYTVYFNANSGVCDTASKTVTYDSAYGTLPTPTKTGYTFTGWFVATNSDVQITSATIVNKAYDHTVYARWVANDYTVTFNANGGTVSPTSKTVTFDSTYGELPTPTRTGYTFSGWYSSETGGAQVVESTVVSTADNHSIYAHWIANELNVSFNPNGGTCTTTGKTVTYDSAYGDLPTASRTGYTFDGWATAASGGEKIESSTIVTIPTDHTLYAQWVANTYTVTFDANTGVCDTASKEVTYDSTYGELPVPTKTCYTFIGWFTQATGGDVVSKSTKVSITSNQTLYAHWVLAGHDYADEIVPPTCSAEGYTIHTCTRCGDTYIDSYVPVDQDAHSWVVKSIDSTTHTYECEYCHTTKTEEHIKDMDGNCLCDSEFTDGAYEVDIVIGGKVVCFKYMPTDETFDPSTFSVPVQYRESKYRVGHDTVLTPRADYQNPKNGDVITYDADFEYTDYAGGTFDVTVVDKGVTTVTSYGWYEKATIKSSWAGFLYWVDEYGNIVSTYKVYYFLTVKDTTLTAVYKSDVSDPSAEKAFIKTNFAENGDDDSLTFYSERCVNYSNYTLLSHGIVLAPSSKVGSDYNTLYNSLVCGSGNSSIIVYDKAVPEGQSTAKCYGSFTVAVPQKYLEAHSLDNEVWYARAYVLVENKTTGEIEYHYGDIAEFDLSDPNATFTRRTDVKNDNLLIAAI